MHASNSIIPRLQVFINRCLRNICRIFWSNNINKIDLWHITKKELIITHGGGSPTLIESHLTVKIVLLCVLKLTLNENLFMAFLFNLRNQLRGSRCQKKYFFLYLNESSRDFKFVTYGLVLEITVTSIK